LFRLLWNSVAKVNLTRHDDGMRIVSQAVVAALVAMAILIVLACPLTLGPPAPQVKYSAISALLACVFMASIALLLGRSQNVLAVEDPSISPVSSSDRLAFICTLLC
jgi:hypothetical protein